jgi:hypothetical protein
MAIPVRAVSEESHNQLMREPSPVRVLSKEEVAKLAGLYSPPSRRREKVIAPFLVGNRTSQMKVRK